MTEFTLYTNPMSRGRMARWACEELVVALDLAYDTEILEFGTSMKAREYMAINPMGKVPALRHGDVVVTEVAAICAYLADAFPAAGLAPPADSPLRGPYYRWLFFGAGPVEQAVSATALEFVVPPEREATVGYGSLARVLDTLEGALDSGGWLAGDSFTMADLYIGAELNWGMRFGTIDRRGAFVTYCDRLTARPAYLRAAEIDNALMPNEGQPG